MTDDLDKQRPPEAAAPADAEPDVWDSESKCGDIQALLLEYVTQEELGEGRRELVREHLRRCATCRAAARTCGV